MNKKIPLADIMRRMASDLPGKEGMVEEGTSTKEKPFVKMPSIKPPRRQTNNVTDTREYRREYQKDYRAENGNGYIPKPKKKKEEPEDDNSRFT